MSGEGLAGFFQGIGQGTQGLPQAVGFREQRKLTAEEGEKDRLLRERDLDNQEKMLDAQLARMQYDLERDREIDPAKKDALLADIAAKRAQVGAIKAGTELTKAQTADVGAAAEDRRSGVDIDRGRLDESKRQFNEQLSQRRREQGQNWTQFVWEMADRGAERKFRKEEGALSFGRGLQGQLFQGITRLVSDNYLNRQHNEFTLKLADAKQRWDSAESFQERAAAFAGALGIPVEEAAASLLPIATLADSAFGVMSAADSIAETNPVAASNAVKGLVDALRLVGAPNFGEDPIGNAASAIEEVAQRLAPELSSQERLLRPKTGAPSGKPEQASGPAPTSTEKRDNVLDMKPDRVLAKFHTDPNSQRVASSLIGGSYDNLEEAGLDNDWTFVTTGSPRKRIPIPVPTSDEIREYWRRTDKRGIPLSAGGSDRDFWGSAFRELFRRDGGVDSLIENVRRKESRFRGKEVTDKETLLDYMTSAMRYLKVEREGKRAILSRGKDLGLEPWEDVRIVWGD